MAHAARRLAAHSVSARSHLSAFVRDECGATAIEYALIASLISVLIVTGLTMIGTTLSTTFESVASGFN